jgi:hypothetical protein
MRFYLMYLAMGEYMKWAAVLLSFALVSIFSMTAETSEKSTVGAVEEIMLMPWGVRLPARIDTGATTSSLDVCDVKVEGNYVNFSLSDRCGGHKVRRPLLGWKNIRTSEGSDRRPVVLMDICLGPKLIKTHVTLNDRSHMEYPFLVGRRTLRGKFVVDVSSKNILPPRCAGLKLDMKPDIGPASAPDAKPVIKAP